MSEYIYVCVYIYVYIHIPHKSVNLSLANSKMNGDADLYNYELHIYGDINYVTNSFCKNVPKIATTWSRL